MWIIIYEEYEGCGVWHYYHDVYNERLHYQSELKKCKGNANIDILFAGYCHTPEIVNI